MRMCARRIPDGVFQARVRTLASGIALDYASPHYYVLKRIAVLASQLSRLIDGVRGAIEVLGEMIDGSNGRTDGGSRKRGIFRLAISFLGTGRGLEEKERLYLALGIITLTLAAAFGSILIIGALMMVLRRL